MFINFSFDFILLLTVSLILRRNASIKRLILGALFGGISILSLFIPFSSSLLFIFKIFISIIMILITFKYKNIKYFINNLIYLYLVSIVLGGFLYYLNNELSYKNVGLVFYHKNVSINWILIIILVPVFLALYIYQSRKLKEEYSKMYNVEITFLNNKKYLLTGYLDTGNNLIDPYNKRPIIIIDKSIINNYHPRCILVPCTTVNKNSMIKCFKIKKLVINNQIIKKEVLVGISDNNFNIDGVDLLLHKKILKENML